MFSFVVLVLDAWVIGTMVAASWWIVTDFDVRSSREWASALIMFPAMIWSLALAAIDLWSRAGGWPEAAWRWMAGL